MRRKTVSILVATAAVLGCLSTFSTPAISVGSALVAAFGLPRLLKEGKPSGDFFLFIFVWLIIYTIAFNLGVTY